MKSNSYSKETFSSVTEFIKLKNKYPNNPIISYLNLNSLRNNNITNLGEIMSKTALNIVCFDKTKLDQSFPDFQFHMENYQFPLFRRDGNSKSGGKLVFVKSEPIGTRVKDLETKVSETICIELTITNKKWCILICL